MLFSARVPPVVERYHDLLSSELQRDLAFIITVLRTDPYPDEERKFDLSSDLGDILS